MDLVEAFSQTVAGAARDRFDFGLGPESLQVDGLDGDPQGDESLAWLADRRISLPLFFQTPLERKIRIRAGRASGAVGPARTRAFATFRLNGRHVGTMRVGPDMEVFTIDLPAHVQRPGENRLEIDHPGVMPPGRRQPHPRYRRSLAYDWIEIVEPTEGPRARPTLLASGATAETLSLPAGTRVEYHLRAPEGARLTLELEGEAGAELHVAVSCDHEAETMLASEAAAYGVPRAVSVDLGVPPGEPVRLSLIAAGGGALRIHHPVVLGWGAAPKSPSQSSSSESVPRPNVLLYVIDTLRADHLGAYGYPLPTSPRLDALAREGILFEHAVAQSSWTRPAVASILTGVDPRVHGAIDIRRSIRPEVATLAEILRARGWSTAAFVSNVNVSAPFGFGRGFDTFTYLPEDDERASMHVLSDELGSHAARWLAEHREQPFFLYVHASDPHSPYTPPADLLARFRRPGAPPDVDANELRRQMRKDASRLSPSDVEELVAAYDAEIAFNDAHLGALLDELRRPGVADSTLVIVTADHGEEFQDHGGMEHGYTLYEEVVRIPLVIRLPDGRRSGERRREIARQIDVLPTVLEELGLPMPSELPGRSLVNARGDDPEAHSHTRLGRSDVASVVSGAWKVIAHFGGSRGNVEVFDLASDPTERQNVSSERPAVAGYGAQSMRAAASLATVAAAPPAVVDAETEERLRALGYAE